MTAMLHANEHVTASVRHCDDIRRVRRHRSTVTTSTLHDSSSKSCETDQIENTIPKRPYTDVTHIARTHATRTVSRTLDVSRYHQVRATRHNAAQRGSTPCARLQISAMTLATIPFILHTASCFNGGGRGDEHATKHSDVSAHCVADKALKAKLPTQTHTYPADQLSIKNVSFVKIIFCHHAMGEWMATRFDYKHTHCFLILQSSRHNIATGTATHGFIIFCS